MNVASRLSIVALFTAVTLPAHAASDVISAEIDWLHELAQGGGTGVVLFILLFAMITLALERLLNLRAGRMVPPDFSGKVLPLWREGRFDDIRRICGEQPSTLSRMTSFLVAHREAPTDLLIQGASDIGNRELVHEQKRAYGLAVIAGLAPLLGLLGTIIGMIESFKLVEIYGDEGGATILAGSISKALITTALGLVIAIPALALYHWFKYRTQSLGKLLDEQMELLVNEWLLKSMNVRSGRDPARSTGDAISFYCPGCRQKLKAEPDMAGLSIDCPRCRERITVPASSAA